MIKYNLICECGKTFESWFASSDEHDAQRRKKLINCIYCDSTSVKKSVMAPNLFGKTNKTPKNANREKKINQIYDKFTSQTHHYLRHTTCYSFPSPQHVHHLHQCTQFSFDSKHVCQPTPH